MDSLHDIIIKTVKENNENYNLDEYSLASIILYKISQDDYFKDNYHYLTISKMEDDKLSVYQPRLSYIKGFTNNMSSKTLVDIYFPSEDYDENSYDEDFYYDDYENSRKIKNIYLKDDIIKELKQFIEILEKSCSLENFIHKFKEKINNNPSFVHNIDRYFFQEYNNENEPVNKVEQFLKNLVERPSNYQDSNLCSIVYYKEPENKKGVFSNIRNFHTNSTLYRDTLKCYGIHKLIELNSFKALNLLKNNEDNSLGSYEFYNIYNDDKLGKCPEDISEMISNNEDPKKIYKSFKEKYNSENLNIALSFSSPQKKEFKIIENMFLKIKEEAVVDLKKLINEKYISEKILNKQFNIEKLVKKVKSNFSEFSEPKYQITTGTSKANNSRWISTPDIYDKILEKEKLNIYPENHPDLYTKGLQFADADSFKSACCYDKIYFFANTENSLIGMVSAAINNNCLEICNVSIANYHRNQGVMTNLYRKLANFAVDNNLVITTSMYTDNGRSYIPSAKDKIMKENPDVLFLSSDRRSGDEWDYVYSSISDNLINIIQKNKKNIDLKNLSKFFRGFKEELKNDFFKTKINDYSNKHDFIYKHSEILEQKIKHFFSKNQIKRKI